MDNSACTLHPRRRKKNLVHRLHDPFHRLVSFGGGGVGSPAESHWSPLSFCLCFHQDVCVWTEKPVTATRNRQTSHYELTRHRSCVYYSRHRVLFTIETSEPRQIIEDYLKILKEIVSILLTFLETPIDLP